MARLNKKREVVSHRKPHVHPQFVLQNGQWRFEGPIDNWRIVSKPLGFEERIAQCLPELAKSAYSDPTPVLPKANLLRASREQRAAIAAMILPVLQRKAGATTFSTRMKVFGEAGSGKSMVMHGQQRLMQRLHPKDNKTVLSLAPTGAVAIGMGPEGSTIQSVISQFRSLGKRGRTSEAVDPLAVEKDMQLSPGQLKKLRACIRYDSTSGAMQVKFLVIEEISMVGAAMFWSC